MDVIGARAKNWPIRDGKDQARLIASSAASMVQSNGSARPNPANPLRQPNEAPTHRASVKPPPRGYHDLFAGNDSDASPEATARATSPQKDVGGIRAPKAQSAKPPSRDYHDLFVGNESDASPVSKGKIASQQKENVTPGPMAPKGGAHKNYQPSRLFETADPQSGTPGTPIGSPDKFYKPHPKKYNHFEFGDGDESQKPMAARPKSKHQNNWDFEDFLTPDKLPSKIRAQDIRHFGWSDDEPVMDSPLKHPAVAKARPDAKTNFEFHDEGTPAGERRPANHPRGKGNVKGAGIYENNVFDENDLPPSPEKKGHKVTNLEDMRKNFDPHFSMTDDSPSVNDNKQPIPEARAKVVQQMDAQWESSDQSPGAQSSNINENRILHVSGDKENFSNVGIKSSGDGMGGRKGAGRTWGFGDDSDEDGAGGANNGKFMASKIQQAPKTSGFWDF